MKTAEGLKLARVVSVPIAFVHILKQLNYLVENGVDLHLVSSGGEFLDTVRKEVPCEHLCVDIRRDMNIWRDILAVLRLRRMFRCGGYQVVHSSTPKAGLLCAIAARLAGVPVRLHTFTGQRWVTLTGAARWIMRLCDRIIAALNTGVYADSPSQRQFLVDEGIVSADRISVVHKGCLGGVDFERFSAERLREQGGEAIGELGLNDTALRLVFVGRVTKDKGIAELVDVFSELAAAGRDIDLILVGPFEQDLDALPPETVAMIERHARIHHVGLTPVPECYLSAGHVFCIPSYREGFGTVVVEAAAMGLPAIGTRIPGLVDSILDGETGLLVEPGNRAGLRDAIERFLEDRELAGRMGAKARERARSDFEYKIIAEKILAEYTRLLKCSADGGQ
ncbi:glycosyltransferase family 4 protein [Verrucomicrobiota bacterium]